jgi:hypothetical protein
MLSEKTKSNALRIVNFLFASCFLFWLILAVFELITPGFAIYYVDLSLFLIVGLFLFFITVMLKE